MNYTRMFEVDEQIPKESELHLIIDNYSTHKHDKLRSDWLAIKRVITEMFHQIIRDRFWLSQLNNRTFAYGASFLCWFPQLAFTFQQDTSLSSITRRRRDPNEKK